MRCLVLSQIAFLMVTTAVIAPPPAVAEDRHELRLASDVWPPFTNFEGQPRLAIELVLEALERAGVASSAEMVPWTRVIPGIRDKSFDGSAAVWHTTERESFLLFSEPYLENRLILVGQKGRNVSAGSLSDLTGSRVAVVESYAYGDKVDGASGPELIEGRSDHDNLRKLLAGEVDFMLVDDLLIRHLLEYQGEDAARHLEIGTIPLVRRTLHFALRRDVKEAASIVASFNDAIKTMLADGTYNGILQLNWIRADVDGDGRLELVPRDAKRIGSTPPASSYHVVWPGSALPPATPPGRFYLMGQVYESWDAVPDYYKVPSADPVDGYQGSVQGLLSFKF